ncbi:MAG: hypothetical protein Edafosvirus3_48 [Edafosvirus sp.]|uniref:Uncharacterized protein n=1 Tax=Edafosvirus sp. TaxID=2487765 RepID=A0A3G4ZSU5_9VIRU|nr:MAG: hypothetical protein Edafosvirus3_48 [Edafosvirus sp.]
MSSLNKNLIYDTMLNLTDPRTGKPIIKKVVGDTIYWDVAENEIAPWKTYSHIVKAKEHYTISFPTDDIKIGSVPTAITAKLVLSDKLLTENKIALHLKMLNFQPEYLIIVYNINPTTYEVMMDAESGKKFSNTVANYYTKYGLYPSIINSFVMWIDQLLPMTLKNVKSMSQKLSMFGGGKHSALPNKHNYFL